MTTYGNTKDSKTAAQEHVDVGGVKAKRTLVAGWDGANINDANVDSSGNVSVTGTVTTSSASSVIDANNSTTTPLIADAVWTGTAVDCTGYSNITNTIYADQDSATDGMEYQFCSDSSFGVNTDTHKFTLEAGSQRRFQFPVTARYFRIKFTNGGTGQGAFDVQNILHTTNVLTSIHRLGDTTTTDRSAQLTKSAIMGETTAGGGGMVNVKVNPSGTLQVNASQDTDPWIVDGSGVTQPVSGTVTVANPTADPETGLATSANQLPDGHAVTVDNVGGVEVVQVTAADLNCTEANSGTIAGDTTSIDGKITACDTGAVVVSSGAITETNSGAIKTAVELIDNAISGSEMQVDVVTQPARDRLIDNVGVAIQTDTILSDTTALTPKFAVINVATSGDNTLVAAVSAKKIRVLSLTLVMGAATTVRFESGAAGTALTGQMEIAANSGLVLPFNPVGHFETASNTLLNLELSAANNADGFLTYIEV